MTLNLLKIEFFTKQICINFVDEMGVDKMGVDEMGSRQVGIT